ncbi:TPA: hypothetical protein K8M95_001071 [Clostridium perfringens]|uniref:hypothetical protein n=1 Tax=Clostridium perfringens TaxID=1502 RepID=UPI001CB18AEF|nr:hypothetical protein [Clostridium perfringens]MDK0658212.1 hypothetical protein [Clostridium perfringens]MDM0661883.1 hypothetical protein [Clostridium perfringens]HBI6221964.1 hypothetical protein [Clostridium perfringens]HBI7059949.1 hypothetical protein [Clostridium perfringens]HBI7063934.1 hypothetical protein [Clostridium perfringens]
MLGEIILTGIAAISAWHVANKLINRKTSFETDIKKRFLKTIEEMQQQPLNNSNMTFGLEDIERNELGFEARLIIPVGLCEDNFIKIIPYLENSFASDIEYKAYKIKFIKRSCSL